MAAWSANVNILGQVFCCVIYTAWANWKKKKKGERLIWVGGFPHVSWLFCWLCFYVQFISQINMWFCAGEVYLQYLFRWTYGWFFSCSALKKIKSLFKSLPEAIVSFFGVISPWLSLFFILVRTYCPVFQMLNDFYFDLWPREALIKPNTLMNVYLYTHTYTYTCTHIHTHLKLMPQDMS